MKNFFIAVVMLFAVPSFANTAAEEKAMQELMRAAQQAAAVTRPEVSTVKQVDERVSIGERLGSALVGAAKQLGVAANEFAQTPVGQMTMAIIVWKFLGSALVHVVGGVVILVAGFSILTFMMLRATRTDYKYDSTKTDKQGRAVLISKVRQPLEGEEQMMFAIGYFVVTIVSLITVFTM